MIKYFIAFVVVTLPVMYAFTISKPNKPLESEKVVKNQDSKKSETFPFEELTIPFLRDRQYESKIGTLNPYKEYNNYRSYLTSYNSDNLKINGLITIPKGEIPRGGRPAIVFVHGYIPPTQYKTTEKYIDYVDYLAKNGVIVFKIDLRGHGNSEGEPSGAYYSSDYVIDTLNAYEALKQMKEVNPEKVFLWGHSMAGNVVFRAAAVKKDIPKVFLWAGAVFTYSDFVKYGINDNSYRPADMSPDRQEKRRKLFDTYGQISENSSFWKSVSGANYLEGVTTKFVIQHAADDTVVDIGYSRDLFSLLKIQGKSASYTEHKNGGHNILGTSFVQAMDIVLKEIKQ